MTEGFLGEGLGASLEEGLREAAAFTLGTALTTSAEETMGSSSMDPTLDNVSEMMLSPVGRETPLASALAPSTALSNAGSMNATSATERSKELWDPAYLTAPVFINVQKC